MELAVRLAIPAAVFFAMWVVGLDLTPADFRRLKARPKVGVVGVVGPLLTMPAVVGLVLLALRPPEAVTAGMVLIAAAPGAPVSNLLVYLARGNVALSVTLTAISIVCGLLTFPLLANEGFALFLGGPAGAEFPVVRMVAQLLLLLLLPIATGMMVRWRRPELVERYHQTLKRWTLVAVAVIVTVIVVDQRALFVEQLGRVVGISALVTVVTMAVGFSLGALVGGSFSDRIAYLVEFSARNTALATVVATTTLGRFDYAVFVMGYFAVQMAISAAVLSALVAGRRRRTGRDHL